MMMVAGGCKCGEPTALSSWLDGWMWMLGLNEDEGKALEEPSIHRSVPFFGPWELPEQALLTLLLGSNR